MKLESEMYVKDATNLMRSKPHACVRKFPHDSGNGNGRVLGGVCGLPNERNRDQKSPFRKEIEGGWWWREPTHCLLGSGELRDGSYG